MKVVLGLRTGSTEIKHGLSPCPVHLQCKLELCTVVELHLEGLVLKTSDQPTDGVGRMVLNMLQIAPHTLPTFKLQKLIQQFNPQMIGSCLCLQISPEQRRVSGRESQPLQALIPALPVRLAPHAQPVVAHQKTFLINTGAEGRHGTRRQTAHIRVVPATGHKSEGSLISLKTTRRDRSDIRQVGAAMKRIVADHRVPSRQHRPLSTTDLPQQILNRITHRPKVHRNVRRIGDQRSLRVEQRTGEIEPLADVHGTTGLTQPFSHAFGNLHETVMEEAEIHWVGDRILLGTGMRAHNDGS